MTINVIVHLNCKHFCLVKILKIYNFALGITAESFPNLENDFC